MPSPCSCSTEVAPPSKAPDAGVVDNKREEIGECRSELRAWNKLMDSLQEWEADVLARLEAQHGTKADVTQTPLSRPEWLMSWFFN
jgi:hypothetical protein